MTDDEMQVCKLCDGRGFRVYYTSKALWGGMSPCVSVEHIRNCPRCGGCGKIFNGERNRCPPTRR